MTTYHFPLTSCPVCHSQLDAATNVVGKGGPEEGDLTMCAECTAVLVFKANLSMEVVAMSSLRPKERELMVKMRTLLKERARQ